MKKILAVISLCFITTVANAGCSLISNMDRSTRNVLKKNGSWNTTNEIDSKSFERNCQLLNKHGLSVQINAGSAVLSGVSIGYSTAMLKDSKYNIITPDFANSSTYANTQPSTNMAEEMMSVAIVQSFVSWEKGALDDAVKSILASRREIREAYKK